MQPGPDLKGEVSGEGPLIDLLFRVTIPWGRHQQGQWHLKLTAQAWLSCSLGPEMRLGHPPLASLSQLA